MKLYLKIFFLAFPILVALDVSWFGVIANSFYKNNLAVLLTSKPNYYSAVVFYIFYTIGIMYFALIPALKVRSFAVACVQAAALGFTSYMLYDLTNMTVMTHWPLVVTVVDIAWGTIITAVTSGLTYLLATKLYGLNPPIQRPQVPEVRVSI